MTEGIYAFASTLVGEKSKDIQITIKKVENGYILDLRGQKEVEKQKNFPYSSYESFETTFVYPDLQIALNEIGGFFDLIEEALTKKVKKVEKVIKKIKRENQKSK